MKNLFDGHAGDALLDAVQLYEQYRASMLTSISGLMAMVVMSC